MRRWLGSVATAGNLGVWGSQLPTGTYSPKKSSHDPGSSGQPQIKDGEKLPVHNCLSSTLFTDDSHHNFPFLKNLPFASDVRSLSSFLASSLWHCPASFHMLIVPLIPCTECLLIPNTIIFGAQCICSCYSLYHQCPFPDAWQTPMYASRPRFHVTSLEKPFSTPLCTRSCHCYGTYGIAWEHSAYVFVFFPLASK